MLPGALTTPLPTFEGLSFFTAETSIGSIHFMRRFAYFVIRVIHAENTSNPFEAAALARTAVDGNWCFHRNLPAECARSWSS